jgi:outer membrane protein assembly factor BamD (BamD/ComL family)
MLLPERTAKRSELSGHLSAWRLRQLRLSAGLVLVSSLAWGGCAGIESPGWMRSATNRVQRTFNGEDSVPMSAQEREERLAKARIHWQVGDEVFRGATQKPREAAAKDFIQAAKQFEKAAKAHPGSAIAQDALFMQGESLFFADQLPKAEQTYGKLQKQFPNSRHNDRAAARLFSIAQYWIETERAGGSKIMPVNFVDSKRPWFDIDGHGIRVLDQIRYNDPSGRLADDATMAAAVEHFRQGKYADADEFLTDLRETFTDSDHLFNAYMLGIRCKLEMYAGPKYSQLTLDEADKLIRQVRTRFPDRMQEPATRDTIAKAAAEVDFRKAERLYVRAQYRERRREYGAARLYYQQLLADFNMTPYADQATTRLAAIEPYPAIPDRPLIWLTKVFPEAKRVKPLITSDSGTVLR